MSLTTAVMETAYTENFNKFVAEEKNGVLSELRKAAFAEFVRSGFPTPKLEDWKYTNVAPISNLKFEIANLKPEISNLKFEISNLQIAETDNAALETLKKFNFARNGFAALNLAFAEVLVVRIPKETAINEPLEFKFAGKGTTAQFPHIIIIAEAGSKATIIEQYSGDAKNFTDTAVQIVVEDNAHLTHYRVQKESAEAFHVGTAEVTLKRGSSYNSTNINLGGAISRHDIEVKFTQEGAEAFVDGLYMIGGTQHADTHSIIDHTVPNCTSHQSYKGVLNDRSRAVFNGKVFVRENAHGTDAEQSNKNLLLSNDARVDTKPQLEIFNDDVKCSHGATVGQLEDEELFYLLTRGIPESLAKNLLTYGFAEEIINKIEIEAIKSELDAVVLNRLNAEI